MNEQELYPSSGITRAGIVTNPNDLPRFATQNGILISGTSPATHNTTAASFFDAMARGGAVGSIVAADAYHTIVDIAGEGFLGNVISPHSSSATKTLTIRLTVDTVEWVWQETLTAGFDQACLLLGARVGGGNQFEAARPFDSVDLIPANSTGSIVPVSSLMQEGAPVLAFSQSLKVEVMSSVLNASQQGNQAGCTYVLR